MPRPHTFSSLERKAKYRKKILVRTGLIFLAITVVVIALIYSLHMSFWRIATITIVGNSVEEISTIEAQAKEILSKKSLFVFPRNNIMLVPLDSIKSQILDTLPRIKEVTVKRTNLTTLEIAVVEREPHALWCMADESCYYIDETAIGYALAPTFSDAVYVKYTKTDTVEPPLFMQLLPTTTYTHVSELVSFLSANGYPVMRVGISADEQEAFLAINNGPELRINLHDDFTALADVIITIFKEEPLRDTDLSSIAYIDMRFGKKIYYRFVGESTQEGTATLPIDG